MKVVQLYRAADSVAQLDATGFPALTKARCTDAIRDHYAPWTAQYSSAPPAMAYRHWADLIRSTVYGPRMTREMARHGDPAQYRTLVYLEYCVALRLPEWVREARAIDPVKGYKLARQTAKEWLAVEAARFRLEPELLEQDMLAVLSLDHQREAA